MTYEANEYPTRAVVYRSGAHRRTWLLLGGALAAVLVMLILIMAVHRARGDEPVVPAGAGSPTATPSAEPTDEPGDEPTATDGAAGPGPVGGAGGSGESGGGSSGSGEVDPGEPEETGEGSETGEPVEPLSIDAAINTVTPGGQCFASGTIAVSGGQYPVTVHYQWRRLVVAGGWEGVPVSPVHNVSFTGPGQRDVQTDALPEEGTNVFLVVTGPVETGSGLVAYDGCSDGPGDITDPGD